MHTATKILIAFLVLVLLALGGTAGWYVHGKQPVRSGTADVQGLKAPVSVAYDERGVPHIRAQNETDMYRALGFVHAQDRLFQMEIMRRLARGELAEVLGPKLLKTDKLFRTLGIRQKADERAAQLDVNSPAGMALLAYLDGVNQFQASHPAPMEFDVLGIPKRPFTPADSFAVTAYLAYSFAAAFKTEPALTYIRDKLGPYYLRIFDTEWNPQGVIESPTSTAAAPRAIANAHALALDDTAWHGLNQMAQVSKDITSITGVPQFDGSNAWVISGKRTSKGKPLLAGDPHIAYGLPAVWYEAHLSAPGFDLYGHHLALVPFALLGHNMQFGWSLTMFQNDDVDLITEKLNPSNPGQVWFEEQWVDLQKREETIAIKGKNPVKIKLYKSPHGPIITNAFSDSLGTTPVAMWWAFLETENPILDAFYELNRANTLAKGRAAAEKIHAPGLNIVWANATGDIAWWAAGKLPVRPEGVNPTFILDASKGEAKKSAYYRFMDNPQEENPARGYIVSANHQPKPRSGVPVPGYYNPPHRAQQLDNALSNPEQLQNVITAQAMQLDVGSSYAPNLLAELLPVLKQAVTDPTENSFLEPLTKWDGSYTRDSIAASLFTQLLYELAHTTMADKVGEDQFQNLLGSRALDMALLNLVSDANSPWWDNPDTKAVETRTQTMKLVWHRTLEHLTEQFGSSLMDWAWGKTHTLTHKHPLSAQKPFDWLLDVGPFSAPGAHETPNNLGSDLGPAPWAVTKGPSTRRIIDFADARGALGVNPVGQSGVWGDKHYQDQALHFIEGFYFPQHLSESAVKANTQSTLKLQPAR